MQHHPRNSLEVLRRIPGFDELSEVAGAHHEKLDGSGYFRGLSAAQLSTPARILAVADIYDALASNRPYREGLPIEQVYGLLAKDAPRALDIDCVEALQSCPSLPSAMTSDLLQLSHHLSEANKCVHP